MLHYEDDECDGVSVDCPEVRYVGVTFAGVVSHPEVSARDSLLVMSYILIGRHYEQYGGSSSLSVLSLNMLR